MTAVAGPSWLSLMLFLFGGTGVPLSLPPLPEDPVMSRVAPAECLWYLSWSGTAAADPASKNQTEQFLAEEEVQRFGTVVEQAIVTGIRENSHGPGEEAAAEELPKLVKLVLTRPAAFFLSDFAMGPTGPVVHAGIVVNTGDKTDEAAKSLHHLQVALGQVAAGADEPAGKADEGWHRLPTPEGAPVVEWGTRGGKYLIVGIGDGVADGIVKQVKAQDGAPAWLAAVRKKLPVERVSMVTYVNVKKITAMALAAAGQGGKPQAVLDALGVANVSYLAGVSGLEGTGTVNKAFIAMDGPPNGIFHLLGDKPLTAADLAPIPRDATFAGAARFDLDQAYHRILDMAGNVEPSAREGMLSEVQAMEAGLGIKLSEDLFQSLGDDWCIYSAPSEGGLLVTGLTLVVPVRDRDKLLKVEERLLALAKQAEAPPPGAGGPHSYRRQEVTVAESAAADGQKIHFLNFIGEPVAVAPAWCITDKELIVSLFPQTIKAHLARGADAGSLADVPAVAQQLAGEHGPTAIGYSDTATVVRTVYPLLQFASAAICSEIQREGVHIDASALPSMAAILPHATDDVSSLHVSDDGLVIVHQGSLPTAIASLPMLSLPILYFARSERSYRMEESRAVEATRSADAPQATARERSAPPPEEGLSIFSLAGGAADRVKSANNLKQFALALISYETANGKLPSATGAGADGKPLLSWRVRILPYIEQAALYEQFHQDEPWDSDHNKPLIAKMPEIFAAPGSKVAGKFKTVYLTPRSKDTMFPGDQEIRLQEVTDGTSNTLMLVEASDDRAVIWTKPDDYEVNNDKPLDGLVGLRDGGFLAAFGDGSVRLLKSTLKPETVKALFTRNGAEVINDPDF